MKPVIGVLIRVYRKTPLYPGMGGVLARLLAVFQGGKVREPFVHDLGRYKMRLDLKQVIDSQLYYTGSFEPKTDETIDLLLPEGGVGVDVGANIGCMTLRMASKAGSAGQVIAFEPTPWAFERLSDNLSLNTFDRVVLERKAVGREAQPQVELEVRSSYRLDGHGEDGHTTVDIVDLDSYFDQHPIDRLDLIKIDTDGMEHQILSGAQRLLKKFHPALLFEVAPDHLRDVGDSAQALLSELKEIGYAFFHEATLAPFDDALEVVEKLPSRNSLNLVAMHPDAPPLS